MLLTNNELGILNGSTSRVDARTERTEAVIIRWTHLNQCNVQIQYLTSEQQRHLTEKDRREISTAFVDSRPTVTANEQGVGPKYPYKQYHTSDLVTKYRDWSSPRSEAKASGWLQSAVTKTHVLSMWHTFMLCMLYFSWMSFDVMQVVFFIAECGIAHFLCAMRVLRYVHIRHSGITHPRLPLCQIAALAHGEKSHSRVLNQSLTHSFTHSLTHSLTQLI